MKIQRRKLVELIIIIILGLVPLLWFNGNQVIIGHDAGLTLSPISHFFDRLFVWTERFSFGAEQSYALAGFFIHGLEALVKALGFNISWMEKIVFIFWFLLPGLTMFYFSSKLEEKLKLKYLALPASIFYMFNHFLLQGWFVAERTKFSLFAAFPLVMLFLFDWEEDKRSSFKSAILISITLFFLNGEASIPLYGGLFLGIIAFVIFYLIAEFSRKRIIDLGKLFGFTILFSALLNAYWLFPFGFFVLNSYSSAVAQAGGLSGILGWVQYVSANSSLINILRLQGIPEWYQNPLHPYSNVFLFNPLMLAVGLAIPILAFFPLLVFQEIKARSKILFFAFLSVFSAVFIAGSHAPFGAFYLLMIQYIPGFIAFRTPFYKFAPALWFSYAILIGFTISYFTTKISFRNKQLGRGLIIISCFAIILYSFPFLNGSFFNYIVGKRSMKVQVPQYIYDFGKWSEKGEMGNYKTLTLPPQDNGVESYKWGYWSLASLTSLLTNAPIINKNVYLNKNQTNIVNSIYELMKNDSPGWQELAKQLGIKYFLIRRDFDWKDNTDDPSVYNRALNNPDIELVKKFGEWEVYGFKKDENVSKEINISSSIGLLIGNEKDIKFLTNLPTDSLKEPLYIVNKSKNIDNELLSFSDVIYIKPECASCDLVRLSISASEYRPILTRDSILYPILEFKNKLEERKAKTPEEKFKFYAYQSLRDILGFERIIIEKKEDKYISETMADYAITMNKLKAATDQYLSPSSNIDNKLLMDVFDILKLEEVIIIRDSLGIVEPTILNPIDKVFNTVKGIKSKIEKNTWQTTDETNKVFIISSPIGKNLSFLYHPNDSSLITQKEINFSINDIKHKVTPDIKNGWFSMGEIPLSKGLNRLEIEQPAINLYGGSQFLQIISSSQGYCYFFDPIRAAKKADVYRISFQHRKTGGIQSFFVKYSNTNRITNSLDKTSEMLNSEFYWENYSRDYAISKDGEVFYPALCTYPLAGSANVPTQLELRNINIRKIDVPDVVLYAKLKNIDSSPELSMTNSSQTNYSFKIKSETIKNIITLNETYDQRWELNGAKNDQFVINGIFNGWIIDGKDADLSINYKSQDFVKIGFALTGISFLAMLLTYLFLRSKGYEKKN